MEGTNAMTQELVVFALDSSRPFGEAVCRKLGISLGVHEERDFEDGEHKTRPLINVRGKDVFVIQSLYGEPGQSVNDKLCRYLFFIGALRDAGAGRVIAVAPYLCYARKDRKSKARDPVTTRYLAMLFEAVGAGGVVTLDVHNLAAYQNAWRIPSDHLEARKLFVQHFVPLVGNREVAVVSPDVGGVKRTEDFRLALSRATGREIHGAFVEKYRSSGVISGDAFVGNVSGKVAIILDDLISSGSTLVRAAEGCRAHGASGVYAAASHGVFASKANDLLSHPALDAIVITNTVPPFRLDADLVKRKITMLDVSGMFAEAIGRMHSGGSIVDLIQT